MRGQTHNNLSRSGRDLFRIWIVEYRDWQPRSTSDVPPKAIAIEPAAEGVLPSAEAAIYIAAFNQAMLAQNRSRWAVGVPVVQRFDGDLQPGEAICRDRLPAPPKQRAG